METIREFIELLQQKGDIAHVARPVSGEGVAALIWELNERKGPALWCDNVNGSRVPLVANLFGSFSRVALALGLPDDAPPKQIRNHYADIMEDKSKWPAPQIVKSGPCKEVIRTGNEIDLFHFPIFKWAPGDGGPYITLNGTVSKDPELGRNVGMYRVHVINKNTTGIMALSMQDIGIHLARARERGEDYLEVAILIGMSPAVYLPVRSKGNPCSSCAAKPLTLTCPLMRRS